MKRQIAIEVISFLLIVLFVYASTVKLINHQEFISDMNKQPFPNWTTAYLVWGIPVIELAIATSLVFTKTRKFGLYASFGLMLLFTGYIAGALLHLFKNVPCSCGGLLEGMGWKAHLIFNLLFVLLSLAGIILTSKKFTPGNGGNPSAVTAGLQRNHSAG